MNARTIRLLAHAVGFVAVSACSQHDGTSMGDDAGQGSTGVEKGDAEPCEWIAHEIGPDDETPYGSAAELVAKLSGTRSVPLMWHELEEADYPQEGEVHQLELEIPAEALAVRELEGVPTAACDQACECFGSLEVDVQLGFSTAEGSFADSWIVTLAAIDSWGASLWIPVDMLETSGTFQVDDIEVSSGEIWSVELRAGIQAEQTNGQIWLSIIDSLPDGKQVIGEMQLASWGEL